MLQVGNLQTFEHDRANFGAWIIISAPLYLSFDLRDPQKMDRVWPLVTNREAIQINQQYAGHPGRLVRAWTPAAAAGAAGGGGAGQFVVTADLHHCQRGWSYDNVTGQIQLAAAARSEGGAGGGGGSGGCITVPKGGNSSLGSTYYDDAALVLRPCSSSSSPDPAQRFERKGDTYVSGTELAEVPGQLQQAVGTAAKAVSGGISPGPPIPPPPPAALRYIRAQPWWEGAGVELGLKPGQLFFVGGRLQTRPGTLAPNCTVAAGVNHCEINFASDVCVNGSPTMDHGAAIALDGNVILAQPCTFH
jgi:hypothetical protein